MTRLPALTEPRHWLPLSLHRVLSVGVVICALLLNGCASPHMSPKLGTIYSKIASYRDPYRNPIIVIPGFLGSKLVDSTSGVTVWGAFGFGAADPATPAGAQLIALPMEEGKELSELRDGVAPAGALDRVVVSFLGFPVQLNSYYNILSALGVGGYKDEELGRSGAIDYGNDHFTCFQFPYDWRRDIVETARELDRFIQEKRRYIKEETRKRYGIDDYEPKFDIVAHSMGGLVARYYLRYGGTELPMDDTPLRPTWAGARFVEHAIMIAPPNAGTLEALTDLVQGDKPGFFFPYYSPAILGTMPAVYQLLPRSRHAPLLDSDGTPVADILDPRLWEANGWGLADPKQDEILRVLLPAVTDVSERRRIALDHQRKSLARARRFAESVDIPSEPPPSLKLLLVAGDAVMTARTIQYTPPDRFRIIEAQPGDKTVLRSSALMDERDEKERTGRVVSPIRWDQVLFLPSDHLGLTRDPAFTDNILYFLLERPKDDARK